MVSERAGWLDRGRYRTYAGSLERLNQLCVSVGRDAGPGLEFRNACRAAIQQFFDIGFHGPAFLDALTRISTLVASCQLTYEHIFASRKPPFPLADSNQGRLLIWLLKVNAGQQPEPLSDEAVDLCVENADWRAVLLAGLARVPTSSSVTNQQLRRAGALMPTPEMAVIIAEAFGARSDIEGAHGVIRQSLERTKGAVQASPGLLVRIHRLGFRTGMIPLLESTLYAWPPGERDNVTLTAAMRIGSEMGGMADTVRWAAHRLLRDERARGDPRQHQAAALLIQAELENGSASESEAIGLFREYFDGSTELQPFFPVLASVAEQQRAEDVSRALFKVCEAANTWPEGDAWALLHAQVL